MLLVGDLSSPARQPSDADIEENIRAINMESTDLRLGHFQSNEALRLRAERHVVTDFQQ